MFFYYLDTAREAFEREKEVICLLKNLSIFFSIKPSRERVVYFRQSCLCTTHTLTEDSVRQTFLFRVYGLRHYSSPTQVIISCGEDLICTFIITELGYRTASNFDFSYYYLLVIYLVKRKKDHASCYMYCCYVLIE